MLITLAILALYFWTLLTNDIHPALWVSDIVAIMAGASLLTGLVAYLWVSEKYIFIFSLISYLMLGVTTVLLIMDTGWESSPFIALWMIILIFSRVFGFYAVVPIVSVLLWRLTLSYLGESLTQNIILILIFAGFVPLVASFILWNIKEKKDDEDAIAEKIYSNLSNKVSSLAGKSEIVINAIADGVIALNNQGIIELINPAAQQIIGWGRQDAVSLNYKSVLKLLDKNDQELTTANDPIYESLSTNKEITNNNLTLVTKSGKKILVSIIVSPIGQIDSGVIVVFRNITNEKKVEREQAEFISTAAHEMRTPVASIEGYLGLAINPATAQIDEKARMYLSKAHESAQHLGRLFQDLLDVSKAEDGRLSNNPKVVDVVDFAHKVFLDFKTKAAQKGLRYIFKPIPDEDNDKAGERRVNPVFYSHVDIDHLREILSNLIDNAIKYTPQGDVVVDVSGDNNRVIISVMDNGIGIPKEDQTHLFQKFYRIDNSDTREIGGTGLGLYLCRRLIETMNGRIYLESEYKKGSTFFVEIPRIDHEEATRLIEALSLKQEAQHPQIIANPQTPLPTEQSYSSNTEALSFTNDFIDTSNQVGTVYTTQPVEKVAEQLQNIRSSEPLPRPQYQTPQTGQESIQQGQSLARPNIPLASIEKNPENYLNRRDNRMNIPQR